MTGLVFDPAAMARLAAIIEEAIAEARESGLVIEGRDGRRRVCKEIIAALVAGETDPGKLKQVALKLGPANGQRIPHKPARAIGVEGEPAF